MDYRMIKVSVSPEDDVVNEIVKELKSQKLFIPDLTLKFIGFEAPAGTEFYLNSQETTIEVPSCGNFITPYFGERGLYIRSLKFKDGFTGNIYYII